MRSAVSRDTFILVGRALLALLFIPAGWAKVIGFAGVSGYIASKGVPLPEVAAIAAGGFSLDRNQGAH